MSEYKKISDLPKELQKEIKDNKTFFDNIDGKSLDEQQRIACVLNDCDLEIIAGAGTGKTQTLVAKTSYLIEKKNIKPTEILCLSFSKSCVSDLTERLNHDIETRTLHSLGLYIITKFDNKYIFEDEGFYEFFNTYLEEASPKQLFDIKDYCETYLAKPAVKEKLKEMEYEEEKLSFLISNTYIVKDLKQFINLFKGKDYDVSDLSKLKKACEKDLEGSKYYFKNMGFLNIADSVFRHYQSFLSRNQMIDFNDMINKAIKYVNEFGFDENYKYIFVDEYQDMSYKNFQLLKAIKEKTHANLVVVGDDWQSIYGFRDSDLGLFTNFYEYFPDAKRVFIEKTYRNPQELIDTAGKFIMKNENQYKKSLKSDTSINKPIKILYHSLNSERENNTIYNLIYNLSQDNEVLILGRHKKDIDEFLKETDLVKKGRSRTHKKITDKYENIENVEFRTIHKAKGLEADYTIIIQVIDDWLGFPNKLSPPYFMTFIQNWDKEDKFEEERRLFYVALTRAKKGVYIFTTQSNESKYIDELIDDSPSNLEIVYTDDNKTYSHLKEFEKAPKPKKPEAEIQLIDVKDSPEIEIKANLKRLGNQLMKRKDYDEAEDFYKKLISNKYFVNDYYPFRKLVEVYKKKRESENIIKTIEEFFESNRYCNDSQLSWFKLEFRKACKYTKTNFNIFEEYVDYFNNHGVKNKSKENEPVPIAARIDINGESTKLKSQEDFDETSRRNELKYNYKFERDYGTDEKALYYFEQIWHQEGFKKNLTAYKRLCRFYEATGQYEKVIDVALEYFDSNAKRTKGSPDWFRKKIRKAESKLNKNDNIIDEYSPEIKKSLQDSSQKDVITVARNNFYKLLSSDIGDEIIVRNRGRSLKLEILSIDNPKNIHEAVTNVKIDIVRDNFVIVENLGHGGTLTIKHKNTPGEIRLKITEL